MSDKTTTMLESLGILGSSNNAAPEPELEPSAPDAAATSENADESETLSLSEALELADGAEPQDAAVVADAQPEEPPQPQETDLERLQREIDELRAENERLLEQDTEEAFEADWADVITEGQNFYRGLIADIKERAYQHGRTRQEVDAVIKYMVYDGNEIERLDVPAGTPGYIQWQNETLLNYAHAKGERGSQKAQPSEMERLTQTYNLTETDQVTLRKFANYPPEAREEIAKNLGAKNTAASTRQAAAEQVAATNVAARLSQAPAPGVPGPAQRRKEYVYTHDPSVKRAETQLFVKRMGLVR